MAKPNAVAASKAKPKVNLPATVAASFAAEVADIAKSIGAPSGDRIAATQGKMFKLPNGSETEEFDAIVLDFVAANYYYESGYDKNNITPPDCFAIGLEPSGLVASDNSPDKQCNACAGCWANAFKSAKTGNGKACSNTRLLAVILVPPGGFAVNDNLDDLPIYTLKVSPTALKSFDGHVSGVVRNFGIPVRGVITNISFSADSDFASMRFSTVAPCNADMIALANARVVEARERLLTEPDVSAAHAANDAPAKKAPAKRAVGGKR